MSLCGSYIPNKNNKTLLLHTSWQCSALNITDEASNWSVSLSWINPDLIIRFTCAFSCLHLMHESHCFLFSECFEGSKKSFLFHLHVMPTCSISWLYPCVWYEVLLIKALKIASRATITCNNSGTGALAPCDRTRSSPRCCYPLPPPMMMNDESHDCTLHNGPTLPFKQTP